MIKVLLIVVQGKPEGKTIPLTGPLFKVGRGEGCHLRPNSDLVSREHAEFSITEETATVRDLGSRNGTLLNGRALSGASALKSGDLVQIGPLTFAVAIQGAAGSATANRLTPPPGGKSLDDLSHDQIDSWLIADNNRPTPDRPSGVYDGDTLTLNAYNATKPPSGTTQVKQPAPVAAAPAVKPPSSPATPVAPPVVAAPAPAPPAPVPTPVAAAPVAPAPVVAAAPAPPKPTPAPPVAPKAPERTEKRYDDVLEDFERLPEGVGDGEEEGTTRYGEEEEEESPEGSATEELIDESNPFFVAKNKKSDEPVKPVFKDTSDAASDILRKMLDRRRAAKS